MRIAVLFAGLAVFGLTTTAAAQFRQVQEPPRTWVTGSVGGILDPATVDDGSARWDFGTALGGGIGVHRRVGSSLLLGVDAMVAPSVDYEVRPQGDGERLVGSGRLGSVLASARLDRSGGSDFGFYLTGGAGVFAYSLPEIDRFDTDLALYGGTGLEYRLSPARSLYLEWGRFWAFHSSEETVRNHTARHQQLRMGVRTGW